MVIRMIGLFQTVDSYVLIAIPNFRHSKIKIVVRVELSVDVILTAHARVAQLAEPLICNQQVVGSTPTRSLRKPGGDRVRV